MILLLTLSGQVRLAVQHEPEMKQHGTIFLQNNATHHHHYVQNLAQYWHWDMLPHSPYSLNLTPYDYWLFPCVKEHLWAKQFESEDNISIAVTVSLHHLCKYE
jgi:hypothetical protein